MGNLAIVLKHWGGFLNIRKIKVLYMKKFLFFSTGDKQPSGNPRKITPVEAHEIMQSGKAYTLLDVRTAQEHFAKHIPNSLLVPDVELAGRAESELPDKDALILVYCLSGGRSAGAARMLARMGYTNVCDFGGINSWFYETESGE